MMQIEGIVAGFNIVIFFTQKNLKYKNIICKKIYKNRVFDKKLQQSFYIKTDLNIVSLY